jgi:hypothetical protein
MELFLFFLLIGVFVGCLAVGAWKGSFVLWIIGCLALMLFGYLMFTEGVKYVSGADVLTINADADRVVDTYTVLTNENSPVISFLGQISWYGGILLLGLGAVLAVAYRS